MRVVAREVTQVHGYSPVLMLRRDGGLWAWNEWRWVRPGESKATPEDLHWHGVGFERLSRSSLELAWRTDGMAWAWGRTLTAMTTPEALPGLDLSPWPRLVGQDWLDVKASIDYTLVAARKSDGSLWVSQVHGQSKRMDRLGCGFSDFAFAYDWDERVIHLLALRSDGTLLDYHGGGDIDVQRDLLGREPDVLGNGGVKLFQENDLGDVGGKKIFLLRRDGTLGQRLDGKHWLRIDFPTEWFLRGAPPQ
jgi:hypothetical protein